MSLFKGRQARAEKLYSQKKYEEAEKLFDEVVHDRERTLGKDHKRTLTNKSWLAHTLYQLGKYQEAQRIFQEVANARESTLGSGHEDTLASNQWLSNTKWQLRNEPQKADKPFDKTAHGQEKKSGRIRGRDAFLGKDDELTLGLKLELGQLLLDQNRHQEAGSIFQEVKDVRERAMAKDHEDKAARKQLELRIKLSEELQTKLSEQQEAEENLRQRIRGRDAFLGKDDKITLGLKLELGQLLLDQNRHQEAGSIFQEVEDVRAVSSGLIGSGAFGAWYYSQIAGSADSDAFIVFGAVSSGLIGSGAFGAWYYRQIAGSADSDAFIAFGAWYYRQIAGSAVSCAFIAFGAVSSGLIGSGAFGAWYYSQIAGSAVCSGLTVSDA
ncbi:hypothetical protein N7517_001005 [Penicillium concentricum]|uniref:Uncharacterized protein n=1 Tax=Penicillium concentricum TaxID=293559 RepID=A0A9W9VJG6_9EURO|nr:uncharacterized protein N7517_001005 [Penicillium concentricum]KAJ5383094.1 hypothetical protein N7517_001005 [Penicillium concentricum]